MVDTAPIRAYLAGVVRIIKGTVDRGPYAPENGAQYPSGTFGARLSQAVMLLKRPPGSRD